MAKKLRFKDPDMVLVSPGMGKITNDNLTEEKYNRLVALAESHKDFFVWEEEPVAESKALSKSKPQKNESSIQTT